MTILDSDHTFTLTIAGTDRWSMVLKGMLTLTDIEGSAIDTLRVDLKDSADALAPNEWQEVILTADGTDKLFGGFTTMVKPTFDKDNRRLWSLTCESYVTLLARTPRSARTWVGATIGSIVGDLFTNAGLTPEFNAVTHVTAGATLDVFSTSGNDTLPQVLNTLRGLAGDAAAAAWAWRIDADKALWFGAAASDTAAFNVCAIANANWNTTFPMTAAAAGLDASQLVNRVTVYGGVKASTAATETFNGNGATVLFRLAYKPVRDIVRVTLAGVLQSHGTDWYDAFGGGYNVLVNYAAGTVRFPAASPPPVGVNNIAATYRYNTSVAVQVSDTASYAAYGRYFDQEIAESSITSEADATDRANAILDAYAFGVVTGSFTVERLGLKAGQQIGIEFAPLGLTGSYVIRQVTTTWQPGGTHVRCDVKFGGRPDSLSQAVGGLI